MSAKNSRLLRAAFLSLIVALVIETLLAMVVLLVLRSEGPHSESAAGILVTQFVGAQIMRFMALGDGPMYLLGIFFGQVMLLTALLFSFLAWIIPRKSR